MGSNPTPDTFKLWAQVVKYFMASIREIESRGDLVVGTLIKCNNRGLERVDSELVGVGEVAATPMLLYFGGRYSVGDGQDGTIPTEMAWVNFDGDRVGLNSPGFAVPMGEDLFVQFPIDED